MANFVHRCLELADKRGMTSLAFPALGTGVLGFPADIVARLLFETIQDYEYVNPDTGIRSVLLVVYYDDTPTVQVNLLFNHGVLARCKEKTYRFCTGTLSGSAIKPFYFFN